MKSWSKQLLGYLQLNESATSFWCYVVACLPNMFCNFYLTENHKITHNSTTIKVREKISTDLESLHFKENSDMCLTRFITNQIVLNKISHQFLDTTKIFNKWNIPIKARIHVWCESGNFAKQCDSNRRFPIFSKLPSPTTAASIYC